MLWKVPSLNIYFHPWPRFSPIDSIFRTWFEVELVLFLIFHYLGFDFAAMTNTNLVFLIHLQKALNNFDESKTIIKLGKALWKNIETFITFNIVFIM